MIPIYEKRGGVTVRAARPEDTEAVVAIRNHAVEHSTALWTQVPHSPAEGQAWFADHLERGSALVAEVAGEIAGYASYAPWRALEGYRHTVEDSVYVRDGHQGLGIGGSLLTALIATARATGQHSMIAAIESGNSTSIRLHEHRGFDHVGTLKEAGTKFGRWFDLTLMQLRLGG
ncbi:MULTISPECIES: GNAT family N-acetyltransferase [unclassified Streptomyces]|uniref:GNAT family N-acetyltransferase n=1 Tax=unclassified Streptomyces TaxID=2593676 RepID=UPI00201FBD33|nr:GNAT family N-acetyltransferase [Streptomyces sp. YS415]MCL7428437.1 N-acetyltransferase family protein [Streptomyces sp. YS415]